MPRIRKKTSKRGSTNQREKIKHKAAETRKKRKRDVKKNPQWKSKQKKDPGIPNNFPYKDQILAEVAEQRRQAAEEKQLRKEGKKLARDQAEHAEGSDSESEAAFDGVTGLSVRAQKSVGEKAKAKVATVEEVDDDVPVLMNPELPNLKAVLDLADVVIEVLDARDPLRCRSKHIEELSESKKLLLVLNKVDTCPQEAVASWSQTLRANHPTVLFRSASAFLPTSPEPIGKGKAKERADDAWGLNEVSTCLQRWADEKTSSEPLVVAVVGIVNAGKSSFVNSLLRKATLSTYALSTTISQEGPSTTTHPQEVTLELSGKQLRIIDTPGLLWHPSPNEDSLELERIRASDILIRSKGRIERLKDPSLVVAEIVSRASKEDLMLFYNLPAFPDNDPDAFLSGLARSHGLIKKGGVVDLAGAARIVLRDWSTGKFPRYSIPSSAAPSELKDLSFADVYAKDEQILSKLPSRKDMRKNKGVVKMKAGDIEARQVIVDASWLESDDEGNESDVEDEDEDEDGFEDEDSEDLEEDGASVEEDELDEDEDEEDEDEEDEEVPPLSGKRKRGVKAAPPSRPAKKVAFAAEPKGTKQARAAAGAKGSLKASPKVTSVPPKKELKSKKPVLKKPAKVANASKKPAASQAKNGEEAYDFKKFF
ncbi:hypothetical protein CERSUDRAFT_111546 [Gelatoporia subvermispora B]|uniref:CP-type G domain-containing protein n=1 Tax=Ceriporiopsis subvermispora (strain B) TaxID=914234 RepID=M2QV59_CERS8|nr:hypothetical protein CERSUDRAFT_111546 [Gelatoporia subvermispora B]